MTAIETPALQTKSAPGFPGAPDKYQNMNRFSAGRI